MVCGAEIMSKRLSDPLGGFAENPASKHNLAEPIQPGLDPLSRFLLDSLVQGTRLRQRNGISYLTLRRWRTGVIQYQIDVLRSLKQNPPSLLVNAIADEIVGALDVALGLKACKLVVPIPCSRSSSETCLSILLAEKVAAKLRLPAVRALSADPAEGKSHPMANLNRPPMRLVVPVDTTVLLVDDVATSGAHIEEATRLLRPVAGSVLSIAWIGDNDSGEG